MPPFILAAIPIAITAFVTVCALALAVGPFVVPLWVSTMEEKQRVAILNAVKGINKALGPIVAVTQTDLDNRAAAVLVMLEQELGKAKGKKEEAKRANITAAVISDSIATRSGVPVGVGALAGGIAGASLKNLSAFGPEAKARP